MASNRESTVVRQQSPFSNEDDGLLSGLRPRIHDPHNIHTRKTHALSPPYFTLTHPLSSFAGGVITFCFVAIDPDAFFPVRLRAVTTHMSLNHPTSVLRRSITPPLLHQEIIIPYQVGTAEYFVLPLTGATALQAWPFYSLASSLGLLSSFVPASYPWEH